MVAAKQPGLIEAHTVYTLAEFSRRTRLGIKAIRKLRARGLRVQRISGRLFIDGADFRDFAREQSKPVGVKA